ncbi:hypothetical protein GGE46_003838 [Rhizobium etli]|jgi:hypothetical protein|uniref:Uncharacterized protein n=1 Tax=Rhizobium etli TaxID=29449 RepID=A0A7W6YAU7_RHIET|nr:hypothetical protein [Rhizobium etli]
MTIGSSVVAVSPVVALWAEAGDAAMPVRTIAVVANRVSL